MAGRSPLLLAIVSLVYFISVVFAATPTEFCKCTCFSNSSIIALDDVPPPKPTEDTEADSDSDSSSKNLFLRNLIGLRAPHTETATCNDCSKLFCLEQKLKICENATDEDVMTQCFQRDSTKDEAIVFIFIFATAGLLIYAAFRPWIDQWAANVKERRTYIPVSEGGI